MKDEMRLAFFNGRFNVAFGIMLICFMGYSVPEWIVYTMSEQSRIYYPSALHQSLGGIFFGSFMLLMPFCASLPYSTSQIDEWRTSYFKWKVLRMGVNRYALQKALATAISGALAVLIPYIINVLVWHIIAMPYCPETYPSQKINFNEAVIWHNWDEIFYALPIYIWIGGGIFFTGAAWALLGLATAIWLPDKIICTIVPVCIYKIWTSGFFDLLLGMEGPGPEALFNDGLSIKWLWESLLCYLVFIILSAILYYMGIRRKSCYV